MDSLSGSFSSLSVLLQPQSSISEGTVSLLFSLQPLTISIATSKLSTAKPYLSIPPSLTFTALLPAFEFTEPTVAASVEATGKAFDLASLLLLIGSASAQLCL